MNFLLGFGLFLGAFAVSFFGSVFFIRRSCFFFKLGANKTLRFQNHRWRWWRRRRGRKLRLALKKTVDWRLPRNINNDIHTQKLLALRGTKDHCSGRGEDC